MGSVGRVARVACLCIFLSARWAHRGSQAFGPAPDTMPPRRGGVGRVPATDENWQLALDNIRNGIEGYGHENPDDIDKLIGCIVATLGIPHQDLLQKLFAF